MHRLEARMISSAVMRLAPLGAYVLPVGIHGNPPKFNTLENVVVPFQRAWQSDRRLRHPRTIV